MVTKAQINKAINKVRKEYVRQYYPPKTKVRGFKLSDMDPLRAARLAGVFIKDDFSEEIKLKTPSKITRANYAYQLEVKKISKGGKQRQAFINSWQAQVYSTLRPGHDPVTTARYADSERETIRWLVRATRWIICGREKNLREVISTGVVPTGSAIAVNAGTVKLTASWLAANVPVLSFVSPEVLVAFTVFLLARGLTKFCKSETLDKFLMSARGEPE